jgi:phosphoribosylformimino-5-aminoimidazole carboxamide ribotide isomerase
MSEFVVFPAIDLRQGQVVRLVQGDPERQTVYASDPSAQARRWIEKGGRWLHVVNLDGAFEQPDQLNQAALAAILKVCRQKGAQVQFGGGLRTLESIQRALYLGVQRVLLGTAAVTDPTLVALAIKQFSAERIGVALDAQDGLVKTRGWQEASAVLAVDLGHSLAQAGLTTVIYTDIARDGTGHGANIPACQALQQATGLQVIASGGVQGLDDFRQARQAGLAGVIVGRALYQGNFTLEEALLC